MHLCLSHTQTLVTLDELGESFDSEVKQWQADLTSTLTSQVCTLFQVEHIKHNNYCTSSSTMSQSIDHSSAGVSQEQPINVSAGVSHVHLGVKVAMPECVSLQSLQFHPFRLACCSSRPQH